MYCQQQHDMRLDVSVYVNKLERLHNISDNRIIFRKIELVLFQHIFHNVRINTTFNKHRVFKASFHIQTNGIRGSCCAPFHFISNIYFRRGFTFTDEYTATHFTLDSEFNAYVRHRSEVEEWKIPCSIWFVQNLRSFTHISRLIRVYTFEKGNTREREGERKREKEGKSRCKSKIN